MKLEFLYTDESYKEIVADIQIKDDVKLTHSQESNLFVLRYEVKGDNSEGAKLLSNIKCQIEMKLDKDKYIILTDGASEYYNKQLYPLYNQYERELRQVIALSAVRDGKEKTKQLARELEGLDFGEIYKALFTSQDFWDNFKKIKRDEILSKKDLLAKISAFEEKTLWDEMFTKDVSFLPSNFDKIRRGRNDVMHAHNINYEEYFESKKLIEKAINELDDIKRLIVKGDIVSSSLSNILAMLVEFSKSVQRMIENEVQPALGGIVKSLQTSIESNINQNQIFEDAD